jgi:hypothetical protein
LDVASIYSTVWSTPYRTTIMDYFDDDDLINDYMEDDFEPPPEEEFPDEYLTEGVVEQCEQATVTDDTVPVRALPTSVGITSSGRPVDRVHTPTIVLPAIDVPSTSSQPKNDPYSFERYAALLHFLDCNGLVDTSNFISQVQQRLRLETKAERRVI